MDDMKHGHGRFYWKNGSIFEGDFSKNLITNGKLKYASGDWFEVGFLDGKQDFQRVKANGVFE